MKIAKIVFWILIVLIIGIVIFSALRPTTVGPAIPNSTVDATALYKLTLTQGPSSAQLATAVSVAKSPYVEWSTRDADEVIKAIRDKGSTTIIDINSAAVSSYPGVGYVCVVVDMVLGKDKACKISLVWTDNFLAFKPQDMKITIEEDKTKYVDITNKDGNITRMPIANITIDIKDFGVIPSERFGQDFTPQDYLGPIAYTFLWADKEWFKKEGLDFIERVTSDVSDLAKADAFAPLNPNGSRSSKISDELYETFRLNLTTPGEGHIYDRLKEYATLVSKANGYGGLDTFTVTIPPKPATPCDYKLWDMDTQFIPERFCTLTLVPSGLKEEEFKRIIDKIEKNKETIQSIKGVDYTQLIEKVKQIP